MNKEWIFPKFSVYLTPLIALSGYGIVDLRKTRIVISIDRQKSKLVSGKPVFFRLKTGFSEIFLRKCSKNQKRPILCGKFREIPVFRKIPPPHHPPQLFFRPLDGGGNPPRTLPTPMYADKVYERCGACLSAVIIDMIYFCSVYRNRHRMYDERISIVLSWNFLCCRLKHYLLNRLNSLGIFRVNLGFWIMQYETHIKIWIYNTYIGVFCWLPWQSSAG